MPPSHGRYPTDAVGIPIPPEELGFRVGLERRTNNHHMNFCAKSFGKLAISQTFRDLELFQRDMPITEHDRLHRLYSGIEVPSLITMMDVIAGEVATGGLLKVYNTTRRSDHPHYLTRRIKPDEWKFLKQEYGQLKDI